jgi:preprotein translocase SecE subunit
MAEIQIVTKTKTFFTEVLDELKKVNWTSREQLTRTTGVVIAGTVFLAVYFWVVDICSSYVLNWFLNIRL